MTLKLFMEPIRGMEILGGNTKVLAILEKKFGETPLELSCEHIPILEGMSAAYSGEDDISAGDRDYPFDKIIGEIEKHGLVRIWWESP